MRIILADHHRQTLWALKTLLQEEPDLEIVGEALDSEDLLRQAKLAAPCLVLVDRKLPGSNIKDLIKRLHALVPKPLVVVMSTCSEESSGVLEAGADAFVSKAEQPYWLLQTLRQFMKDGTNLNVQNQTSAPRLSTFNSE